jgi:hypothetical protein
MRVCILVLAMLAATGCGDDGSSGDTGADTGSSSGQVETTGSGSSSESSSSTGPACEEGRTPCDGACIDLETNPMHCGACGNALPDDVQCVDGEPACTLQGLDYCDGVCIDVLNDDENCGDCGADCGEFNCMGNGCCHVIDAAAEPRSCAQICADAGMTCGCPESISISYMGECDIFAMSLVDCEGVPEPTVMCGDETKCECALTRIDCGCSA